jgi:hypothetical protein
MDKLSYLDCISGDRMTKTYPLIFKTSVALLFLFVSACTQATPSVTIAPPAQSSPTVTFLDLSQITSPAESVSATPEPTETPTSTYTPSPTQTPIPVVIATQANSGCTNQAEFVKNLSFSDNTAFKPGEYFTKVWQILNVGTCTWSTNYRLVYIGGESMQAPAAISLPHEVKPQETVDLRVSMVAPETPNYYENTWMLQDPEGIFFGFGPDYNSPLAVKIQVPWIHKPKPI